MADKKASKTSQEQEEEQAQATPVEYEQPQELLQSLRQEVAEDPKAAAKAQAVVIYRGEKALSIYPSRVVQVDGKTYEQDVPHPISEEEADALQERIKTDATLQGLSFEFTKAPATEILAAMEQYGNQARVDQLSRLSSLQEGDQRINPTAGASTGAEASGAAGASSGTGSSGASANLGSTTGGSRSTGSSRSGGSSRS